MTQGTNSRPQGLPGAAAAVRSYTDNYVNQALLAGENLHAVSIRGTGTIDGNGQAFRWKEYRNRPYPRLEGHETQRIRCGPGDLVSANHAVEAAADVPPGAWSAPAATDR
jgi:hypothetical protein